jgi:hypothetical protein
MSAPIRQRRAAPVFSNGFAVAALALGIVGAGLVVTALGGPVAVAAASLAVVFGPLGLLRARRHSAGDAGMATIGTIAGLLAIAQLVIMYLLG